MADEPIKRLRYFTGQFLEAGDFKAEQDYHVGMRRRGNRALYFAGILDGGFTVKPLEIWKIEISAGVAIDALGRELVIMSPLRESAPAAGKFLVTLSYQEKETDMQTQTGEGSVSDTTRYDETPKVSFFAHEADIDKKTFIIIAEIMVDNTGKVSVTEPPVRQYVHGRFPSSLTVGKGGDGVLNARHIDGKDWRNDNKDDLFLNWNTGKNVHLGFGENTKSSLFVSGNVGIGTAEPGTKLHIQSQNGAEIQLAASKFDQLTGVNGILHQWDSDSLFIGLKDEGPNRKDSVIAFGDDPQESLRFLYMPYQQPTKELMRITATGNVGIGAIQPAAKLTIQTPEAYGGNTLRVEAKNEPGNYYLNLNTVVTNAVVRWVFDQTNAGTNFPNVLAFDRGNVGIGTADPENSEGWGRVLDFVGTSTAKLSIRTNAIDARVLAHEIGWWGSKPGMVMGTKSAHALSLATNGATRLTVDPTGNVGIGTDRPNYKLEVNGSQRITSRLGTNNLSPDAGYPRGWGGGVHTWDVYAEGAVATGSNGMVKAYMNRDGNASFDGIIAVGNSGLIYSHDVGVYKGVFLTNNTPPDYQNAIKGISINGDGNVGLGCKDPGSYKFYVWGAAYATGNWNASDKRFKKNVALIENALDKVVKLKGISYEWKTEEYKERNYPEGRHFGVIAQDVEQVLPDVVRVSPDGEKAVAYTEIIPVLIEAIKEQQKYIAELQKHLMKI